MVYEVTRMPIHIPIGLFFLYLFVHLGILYIFKKYSQDSQLIKIDERAIKTLGFLCRWFPAIYVVLLVVLFYFG